MVQSHLNEIKNLLTNFLHQLQKMHILETYQLSLSPFEISTCQITLLLEQIKCLKIVLLEIKNYETTDVDKTEDLASESFLYNPVEAEETKTATENENQVCDGIALKSQEPTIQKSFELNIGYIEQNNKQTSIIESGRNEPTNEADILLNNSSEFDVINENTAFNAINKDLNSIIVNIDVNKKSSSEMGKQNFSYGESLKTPNPDLSDKKLSDTTDYIEDEPPTPLLYENMSKDLVGPECNQDKTVSFMKEMMENNGDKEASNKVHEETSRKNEAMNEENTSESFIKEIILTGDNTSRQDLSKSEDFIRSMITGKTNTEHSKPCDAHVSTKPDDFLHEILTTNDDVDKTSKENAYLRELITGDTEIRENDSKQNPTSISNHESTPKTEDFIREIVSGVPKDTTYETTETEANDDEDEYTKNKMKNNGSNNPKFEPRIQDGIPGNRTPISPKETASDLKQIMQEVNSTQSDNTQETNQVEENATDGTPSIVFLNGSSNNFMNQIIDSKSKTNTQLNFIDVIHSKTNCDKDYAKYESESLKTPKPIIPEDSNYFTEDHSCSFTVLDAQYKPQSDLFEYNDENRQRNLYVDVAKPLRRTNVFGVESSQEDVGFNYSDSTSGTQASRGRPAVPIHIEQNKIYERETERDMNTFTIPSLSFFNCDTLYDEEAALNRQSYSNTLYDEEAALNRQSYSTTQYEEESLKKEAYHGTDQNYQSGLTEQTYEHGQHENYQQNDSYYTHHSEHYEYNANPHFYKTNDRQPDLQPYNAYENRDSAEYNEYYQPHHYEDYFPNYYQQKYQDYGNEEAPQYPACSYQHNTHPAMFNVNVTGEMQSAGEGERGLQDAGTFPSYDQNAQTTYSYDYHNYECHACAMKHTSMYQYEGYDSFTHQNDQGHEPMREAAYEAQGPVNSSEFYGTDQHAYQQEMVDNLSLIPPVEADETRNYATNEKLLDYNQLICEEHVATETQYHTQTSSSNPKENKENLRTTSETELVDIESKLIENRVVLEDQGESQSESQDLKFFETIKKFTQPPSSFDILGESQQNSMKHVKPRVSKKSAKKRYNDLSSSLVSETEGENSTLTYTQLRTPERENIDYTGDLKRLLASSYFNDGHGLQYAQKSKKSRNPRESSRGLEYGSSQYEKKGKGFCCELCGRMLMTKHTLKYHYTTIHRLNTDQAYVCHICQKAYQRKSVLIKHLQHHDGVKKYSCDYCSAKFEQKISCHVHMLRHRGDFKFECAVCGKKFPIQAKLNFHMKSHEEGTLTCVHCNKKFSTKQYLRQHLGIHQNMSSNVQCEDCGADFRSHKARLSHKQRHHPIALHHCEHCAQSFTSNALLRNHVMRKHNPNRKRYPCEQCSKVFLSRAILNQHALSNHNPDSTSKVKAYQCKLCTKKYSFQSKLSAHMKTHTQSPSIPCPICGKLFYRKDVMKEHQTSHLVRNYPAG